MLEDALDIEKLRISCKINLKFPKENLSQGPVRPSVSTQKEVNLFTDITFNKFPDEIGPGTPGRSLDLVFRRVSFLLSTISL